MKNKMKKALFGKKTLKKNLNKKAFEINMMAWWIIGLGVLAISFWGYLIVSGKLQGAVGYIKNIFRFGVG